MNLFKLWLRFLSGFNLLSSSEIDLYDFGNSTPSGFGKKIICLPCLLLIVSNTNTNMRINWSILMNISSNSSSDTIHCFWSDDSGSVFTWFVCFNWSVSNTSLKTSIIRLNAEHLKLEIDFLSSVFSSMLTTLKKTNKITLKIQKISERNEKNSQIKAHTNCINTMVLSSKWIKNLI